MARSTAYSPWGASVDGAMALLPGAILLDDSPSNVGRDGVRVAAAEAWVGELSRAVARRLTGWQRLSTDVVAPEEDSDRDQLLADARGIVHNGVASYIDAARRPEKSTDNGYPAVLWARYSDGLAELATWLEERLESPEVGDDTAAAGPHGGVSSSFPPVAFPDDVAW